MASTMESITVALNLSTLLATLTLTTTSLAAPLESRASATFGAPVGKAKFKLLTLPASSSDAFQGTWLEAFHTGAGTSAAVLTYNETDSLTFKFNKKTGDIYFPIQINNEMAPYSIGFSSDSPYMSSAPAGYKVVTINIGYPNSNFSFGGIVSNVLFNPKGYGTMAVCSVNGTSPYFSAGSQLQLLWRPDNVTQAPASSLCADVILKAVDSF